MRVFKIKYENNDWEKAILSYEIIDIDDLGNDARADILSKGWTIDGFYDYVVDDEEVSKRSQFHGELKKIREHIRRHKIIKRYIKLI